MKFEEFPFDGPLTQETREKTIKAMEELLAEFEGADSYAEQDQAGEGR